MTRAFMHLSDVAQGAFCALCLILLFSPVMLAVAVGVKLSSPGPVLFRQERIGKNKKPFQMLLDSGMTM